MSPVKESNVPQFSKWYLAIALGIGTPIALGIAYWYVKRKSDSDKADEFSEDVYDYSEENQINEKKNSTSSPRPEKSLQTPLERAKIYKEKGNKYFKGGKYDKAVECYSSAIEICPPENVSDLATFYQNRAAAYENLKNFQAVIDDCSKAFELNRSYVKALFRRAKAYEEIGQLDKALDDATFSCMIDGFQNETYLLMIDSVLKRLSKNEAEEKFKTLTPRLPSKHFARHYFISFSEDPIMKSVEEYKKHMKDRNPKELSGFRLVLHNLAEENYEEVIPNCNAEISSSGPDVPEAYLVRGTFKLLQGQIESSLEDFLHLLSLESVDVKVRVNCLIKIGTLKVQMEKFDEALEDFSKAIELDLNNADIYLHRGQVYLLMERIDECLKDMEKSCSLNPDFPSASAQKCYIQHRCGLKFNDENQKNAALKGFADLEQRSPSCSETLFLYAQVLTECGDFEKADKYFKKAGDLDSKDPNVYVHRGILLMQYKQDVDGAIELMNKAIEMDKKCQFGYETLGTIEVQRGNLQRGLELFEKAVEVAHTETELAHLYSLLLAAKSQSKAMENFGAM